MKHMIHNGLVTPRVERIMALLGKSYCWPKMEEEVETYVKTCLICQQDKMEKKKKHFYSPYLF